MNEFNRNHIWRESSTKYSQLQKNEEGGVMRKYAREKMEYSINKLEQKKRV